MARTWIWILIFLCGIVGLISGLNTTNRGIADAFVGPNASVIPQDALRLRIIANSDTPADQHLKREIRDRVISLIGRDMQGVQTPAAAAQVLRNAVPQVEAIAQQMVRAAGLTYGAQTVFGATKFPVKLYGNRVYPAGVYEALRVTLGAGAGQNWWCVLFPPLCFVALTDGDAVAATRAFPDYPPLAVTQVQDPSGKTIPVALRLASVDYGEQLLKTVSAQFSTLWGQMIHAL